MKLVSIDFLIPEQKCQNRRDKWKCCWPLLSTFSTPVYFWSSFTYNFLKVRSVTAASLPKEHYIIILDNRSIDYDNLPILRLLLSLAHSCWNKIICVARHILWWTILKRKSHCIFSGCGSPTQLPCKEMVNIDNITDTSTHSALQTNGMDLINIWMGNLPGNLGMLLYIQ